MRRTWSLLVLLLLLVELTTQAAVYHLEKVNRIVGGERYVFVHNGRALEVVAAMFNTNGSSMSSCDNYLKSNLTDDVYEYVWTTKKEADNKFLLIYSSYNLNIINEVFKFPENSSSAGALWSFDFQTDSTAKIYTIVSSNSKYIKCNSTTNHTYNVGGNQNTAAPITVYRLVPDTYEREVTVGQLGTVCLPYAVDKVTGADVYQISYLEKDGQGSPKNLYYEIVETELEAGRPYLFVPTDTKVVFQKKCTTMVENPIYCEDGFYGTFAPIQDGAAGTSGNKLEGKYMVKNNTFQKCGGGCSLKANRAYIDMEKVSTSKPQSGAQKRMLVLSKDGVEYITGIKDVRNEKAESGKRMVDGQLVIIKNGVRYNVLGGRL